ncbi:efflux transporter outer membrane subunit [Sphingomonas profundi]|uniref:efflux transporter outer membrane subunit n=1 Tax=Alterirhizorhabdus profundi TaxID=2681549 RepID=UPI0012E87767|nr:efflux transporter outer membrane subunit [Sphingomonas profundi]
MRPHRPIPLPLAGCALAALALAGCTAGRDYEGPPVAAPKAAVAGAFVRAGDLAIAPAPAPAGAAWWRTLADPVLDTLVSRALAGSPNVAVVQARLRQARAALRLERANGAPKLDATALYAHAHLPGVDLDRSGDDEAGGGGSDDLNLYNLGFDASWEIDLFGGHKRTVEAARATLDAAEANVADAQVSLSAEVATAYVNLRDRQRRIALGNQAVAMQEQALALTRQREAQGTASRLDVRRLQGEVDQGRADLAPLNAELDACLDQLATLTGEEPGALDALLTPPAPLPLPPAALAIPDPAAMLRQRPDIRAAERRLASQTARIGVAEAARFPRLSFMGIVGVGGTSLSDLTKLDDFVAVGAPQLSWSFLDFGRNKARVRQAEGVRDEAEGQYRATVLAALRDAEDSLSRFRYGRVAVATLARAKASSDEAVAFNDQRYQAGTATLIDVLGARRQQIVATQRLVNAEAGLTSDYIAIHKALGLGWTTPPATPPRE